MNGPKAAVPSPASQANRITVALLVTIYAFCLAVVYEFIISPRFEYLSFDSIHPDFFYVVIDATVCGVLGLFLPSRVSRPSDLGRIIVFFIVTVPAVVIPTFLSEQWGGSAGETKLYGALAFIVLTGVLSIIPREAVTPLRLPGDTGLYVLLAVAGAAVVVLGSSYGFSIRLHSLTDVYDQREIYAEGGGGTGIVGLATGVLQNALAPIFLALGMYRRSLRWFAVGVVLLLYIYSITGVKSALIGMIFVIGVFALARYTTAASFTRTWSVTAIAFIFFAGIGSTLPVVSIAIDLVVRRILVMQGMLTYNYVEIFGREEPTYYSHTLLGGLFQRPFEGVPPEIVGDALFGRSVHANASFVADGYVSGKLLGVAFAAILIALFLALLDALCSELNPSMMLAATCMVIYITTQSGVVTALLNHGGVALVMCLWLGGSAFRQRVNAAGPTRPSEPAGTLR